MIFSAYFSMLTLVLAVYPCWANYNIYTEPDNIMGVATMTGSARGIKGSVTFQERFIQGRSYMIVKGELSGVDEGTHGLHVHEFGDVTPGCLDIGMGRHFNPSDKRHGLPQRGGNAVRHVGDLGNIIANSDKIAVFNKVITDLSLCDVDSIIGLSVSVTEEEDNGFISDIEDGNSGSSQACGVIGKAIDPTPPVEWCVIPNVVCEEVMNENENEDELIDTTNDVLIVSSSLIMNYVLSCDLDDDCNAVMSYITHFKLKVCTLQASDSYYGYPVYIKKGNTPCDDIEILPALEEIPR